jgi:hypothetical protein
MTTPLEDELVRTLEAAAQHAPSPEPHLVYLVENRRRRRQRRTQVTIAAAAVVALIGGLAVAVDALRTSQTSQIVAPVSGPSAIGPALPSRTKPAAKPAPVDKVWPDAVHEIPDRLPNGTKFQPQTMVDQHTVLVSVESSFEKTSELWLYDIEAGTARKVTSVPTPGGTSIFASNFTVGEGHVVWWLARKSVGLRAIEVWTAPRAGGAATRVTNLWTSDAVDRLAVGPQHVVWSMSGGGVYQAPLDGGEATLIAETEEFGIVSWPWIGSPLPSDPGPHEPEPAEVGYRTLRNLETGEERVADAREGWWTCAVTWCVGQRGNSWVAEHRDGTHRWDLPLRPDAMAMRNRIARDRFVLLSGGSGLPVIHDVATGKTGRLANLGHGYRMLTDERLYYAKTGKGYQLLDMGAI